jgi:hypothetical protein
MREQQQRIVAFHHPSVMAAAPTRRWV